MKLLVVSDTHKENSRYIALVGLVKPDMVIHCGDTGGHEYVISEAAQCPVHIVLGNNDFFSELPRELMLEIEGKKIWVTHGHNYYVSMGPDYLIEEAMSRDVDAVLYGHTHRPLFLQKDGLTVVNPGSISYPRQEGKKPSYALLNIEQGKKITGEICYLSV